MARDGRGFVDLGALWRELADLQQDAWPLQEGAFGDRVQALDFLAFVRDLSTVHPRDRGLAALAGEPSVVGIDEAQFFGDDLIPVVEKLANSGTDVIVAGHDLDYTGAPFGPMPALLCLADIIDKRSSVCSDCGRIRPCRSFRVDKTEGQFKLGAKEAYRPLCRLCFHKRRV